jgi:hypothetical protein
MKSGWFRYLMLLLMIGGLVCLPACDDDDETTTTNPPANNDNNPPADNDADDDADADDDTEPALEKADLIGSWVAPGEPDGDNTVTFSFTLQENDQAAYLKETMTPQVGFALAEPGTWDLAGTTLILVCPIAEMNGNGEVVGGQQVTINGRTYNKQ